MFNLGSGEIALIAVAALLILGPKRLPELARGIGKFLREFRRQTDEVKGVVEREFYRMDAPETPARPEVQVQPANDSVALGAHTGEQPPAADNFEGLPIDPATSQLLKGQPEGQVVSPPPPAAPGPEAGAAAVAAPAEAEPAVRPELTAPSSDPALKN